MEHEDPAGPLSKMEALANWVKTDFLEECKPTPNSDIDRIEFALI